MGWPANDVRAGIVDPYVKLATFQEGVDYACRKLGTTAEELDKLIKEQNGKQTNEGS